MRPVRFASSMPCHGCSEVCRICRDNEETSSGISNGRNGFDDPEVRLVRNDAGDVVGRESGLFGAFFAASHRNHRLFIDSFPSI